MKSTGEAMGMDYNFGKAFAKSQLSANVNLPLKGNLFEIGRAHVWTPVT